MSRRITGWRWLTPETVRRHLHQFFMNLNFPGQLVNNLLQGEVRQSGKDIGRFVTNTTIGIAGFFDPASSWGMTTRNEDFGQTLGVWGVGAGSYIVVPLFGPSNGRDLAAWPLDIVLNVGSSPLLPGATLRGVNSRARSNDQIENARAASLDWYVFVRDAYRQQRKAAIANDMSSPDEPGDDFYDLDDEDDE